ncbi:MAG: NAD(P)H-binding protein [Rhizomicrobium sp.]
MKKLLVIGASGFVGGALARELLAQGFAVRCLARKPESVAALAAAGCEAVKGDVGDPASLERALDGTDGVYVSIHTLSPQSGAGGFMDIEKAGMRNLMAACKATGVRRLIQVTSLGVAPDAPSVWTRERGRIEQELLASGLDVTFIHPGMIVGIGGRGFGMTVAQAKSRVALVIGDGRGRMRGIAIGDLVYYLIGVLDEPRAFGQAYDVGNDEVPSSNEMIDMVAGVLGRRPPPKIHIPRALLRAAVPLLERMLKTPPGALKDIVGSLGADGVGDPMPIRALLPRKPLPFRDAVAKALNI